MKIHHSKQMADTIGAQYARYRAEQLSKLRRPDSVRPAHVPRHLWNTYNACSRAFVRTDGLPILSEPEFRGLMGIDLLDGKRGYEATNEPGIPEAEADLGAVIVAKPVVITIRAIVDGHTHAVPRLYKARVEALVGRPMTERLAWISNNWDLRPEWVTEIITRRAERDFVFGDVPSTGNAKPSARGAK